MAMARMAQRRLLDDGAAERVQQDLECRDLWMSEYYTIPLTIHLWDKAAHLDPIYKALRPQRRAHAGWDLRSKLESGVKGLG